MPDVPEWLVELEAIERDRWLTAQELTRLVAAGGGPRLEEQLSSPFRSPRALVEEFAQEWAAVQAATARMWRATAAVQEWTGSRGAEFVGDDLALVMNTHPRTGRGLVATASGACAVPELVDLLERAELGVPHAQALLSEAARWADGLDTQADLIRLTLERCQARVARGQGWPKPGELKKRLATVALLRDLFAAEKRKRSVADKRGVSAFSTGVEAAALSIEGPQAIVAQMMEAIRARAEALGRVPGDTRSLDQRLFDAAHDLLCVDADGGESRVPTLDADGQPVTIHVRGVEISLVTPYSVAQGGDLELAEIPGLGPVLPSTARELLAQAEHVRRIAVHADTGQVIAVDDRSPGPACSPDVLERLVAGPVVLRDLSSSGYRVNSRLRRFVEHRDRMCVFPGCTVAGHWCDVDHREPWPQGPTAEQNCQCLCRRHHRAKQAYFAVTLDAETGDTVWTSPDGREYRRPPPGY